MMILLFVMAACGNGTPDHEGETFGTRTDPLGTSPQAAAAMPPRAAISGTSTTALRSAVVVWSDFPPAASGAAALRAYVAPYHALTPQPIVEVPAASELTPPASAATTVLGPGPIASFQASDEDNAFPPDTTGAVGPSHLLIAHNGRVRILSRTGTVMSTVTLAEFFASVALNTDVFDPRVRFDPYGGRFIVSSANGDVAGASAILIAVSQTSDPTGSWNMFAFPADPATNAGVADFPEMGFNKNWIAVDASLLAGFDPGSARSLPSAAPAPPSDVLLVCNKAALYAGTGSCTRFNPGLGGRQSPAYTLDPALTTLYLARNISSGSGNAISIDTITGAVGAEVLTPGAATIAPPTPYSLVPIGAPQYGTTQTMEADITDSISFLYRNGFLWGAQSVYLPPSTLTRGSIQWWQATPSGTLQQFARIDDPTSVYFYSYGSLAVNANNDVLVGYSRFSSTQYVSANYSFRASSDPPSSLEADTILRAGESTYVNVISGRNRWGDYSTTAVDPANDIDLWTIQEYAAPANQWATWWGEVRPPSPSTSVTIAPVADAYVRDGSSAGTNFGTATTLVVKDSTTTGNNRISYLRFPLGAVSGTVSSAKLRLFGSRPVSSNLTDSAFAVASNTWTETGITWTNRPALGARQGSGVVVTTTAKYYEWDVTSFVQAQQTSGAAAVSLAVSMDTATSASPDTFQSREASSNPPQLAVTFGSAGAPPTVATPASASPNPVPGTTTSLSVLGADSQGEGILTYTWSVLAGPAPVSFSPNGTNASKNTTATFVLDGVYTLQVILQDPNGLRAASSVNVTVSHPQILTSIAVSPPTASVALNASQQFAATAFDQFGQPISPAPVFAWSASCGGTISATGLFTAGGANAGPCTVTAKSGSIAGSATIVVGSNPPPTIVSGPSATPNPVSGTTTALSVLGADALGESTLTYTWSTTLGPAPVNLSPNGTNASKNATATFSKAGLYNVQIVVANPTGLTASAVLGIGVNQTLTTIGVSPLSATVSAGATQQFTATALDQFGDPIAPSPTFAWSVSCGGTIDTTGLFTAGSAQAGPCNVTATSGSVAGTASVIVVGSTTLTLAPVADAYVRDGASAGINFGTATALLVKNTATVGNNRRSFLMFDITSVGGSIASARLRLFGNHATSGTIFDSAFAVASNTWTENGITWNNQPSLGAKQGASVGITTTAQYYEFDVTSFVASQKSSGFNLVSLAVTMDAQTTNSPDTFSSREAITNAPQLFVTLQ
jgi:hypothetical protein